MGEEYEFSYEKEIYKFVSLVFASIIGISIGKKLNERKYIPIITTAIYNKIDTDGNGTLNQKEFENACQKIGVSKEQLERIVIKAEKEE